MNQIIAFLLFSLFSIMFLPATGVAFVRETVSGGGPPAFWPDSQTLLNLQLGCPTNGPLPFWGPCWDDAAKDAALRWQPSSTRFRFLIQSPPTPASPCSTDGLQSLAFSSTLCGGLSFGGAIAVTIFLLNSATGELIESDSLFDANRSWTTYAGPLRTDTSGNVIYDFHRVAIHELGHMVGLAHPDDFGQSVQAIMNRRVSNVDTTQADDLAGVSAIYPSSSSAPRGTLENPKPGSFTSGIGTISGWVCSANRIDLQVDGSITVQSPYGSLRGDTQGECGDANNGFGYLVNWSGLGPGQHTLVALADGVEFGRATFTVSTFGIPFVMGANGMYNVPFNGRNVTLQWQESLQNFIIRGIE
jgi:hypothetical protein